jgi:hypothetical protein
MYVVPSPSAIQARQTETQLLTLIRCSTALIVVLSLDASKVWRAILYLALRVFASSNRFLSSVIIRAIFGNAR